MSKRTNMQVAIEFHEIIKQIQKEIMKKEGTHISTVKITSRITKKDIERIMLANRGELSLNFDRRRK